MNVPILKSMAQRADFLAMQLAMLQYNIKYSRVSHTEQLLRRMATSMIELYRIWYSEFTSVYASYLDRTLIKCQNGPVEIVYQPEQDNIYINGNFKVSELMKRISPAMLTEDEKAIENG